MKIKKLLISCAALFSCFGLMAFGVHAAIACEVVISGTVSYTVTDAVEGRLTAYVTSDGGTTKKYYNSQTGASSSTEVTNVLTRGTTGLADWALGNLQFEEKSDVLNNISDPIHDIEIHFSFSSTSIKNTMQIKMTPPVVTNMTVQYKVGSGTAQTFTSETTIASVAPNGQTSFTIIMSVDQIYNSVSANGINFGFAINAIGGA